MQIIRRNDMHRINEHIQICLIFRFLVQNLWAKPLRIKRTNQYIYRITVSEANVFRNGIKMLPPKDKKMQKKGRRKKSTELNIIDFNKKIIVIQ